jgi:hypothetical protein
MKRGKVMIGSSVFPRLAKTGGRLAKHARHHWLSARPA